MTSSKVARVTGRLATLLIGASSRRDEAAMRLSAAGAMFSMRPIV